MAKNSRILDIFSYEDIEYARRENYLIKKITCSYTFQGIKTRKGIATLLNVGQYLLISITVPTISYNYYGDIRNIFVSFPNPKDSSGNTFQQSVTKVLSELGKFNSIENRCSYYIYSGEDLSNRPLPGVFNIQEDEVMINGNSHLYSFSI